MARRTLRTPDRISRERRYATITPHELETTDLIRAAALARFVKELDARLKNMQDGEGLAVEFHFDIIGRDGRIRGGRGSQRNMPEYAEWRRAVYERDGYACRECGATGRLNAHHVKPWAKHPDLRFDVDNGLTLCEGCHAKKHPHLRLIEKRGAA